MSLEVNIDEPEEFNCQELHNSIEKVANSKGYEDFEYHVDCISGKGGNFIANIFRVVIKKPDSDDNSFSVIVKTLVNTERQVLFHALHKREVLSYNNVIRKFSAIQTILEEEMRLTLPECLYSNLEKNNEVIILNDLNTQGFEIDHKLEKFEYLSLEQVISVVSELAKFHALSFILEKQEYEYFKGLKIEFRDILFQNDFLNKSKLRNYFFESFEMSLKIISDKEAKKKLKKIKDKLLEILQTYINTRKVNVLCHGDCWVNNMLFKYEESNRIKICLIDYQAMRYANPMTDLMYFLYICTDSKFRSEHIDTLKDTYYNSLKSFLNLFNTEISSLYARKHFNLDFEHYLPFGLLIAMIELRIVTMTHEEDAVLKGSKLASNWDLTQVPGESDFFRHRVNDVVDEAVKNGILDRLMENIN